MMMIVKEDNVEIEKLILGPYETNSYIITCPWTGRSILVDAPGDAGKVIKRFKDNPPEKILITHTHMDHIGALRELKSKWNVPVAVHPSDAKHLPLPADILLADDGLIEVGNIQLKVLHTPGHTPGSVCFLMDKYLIAGDTIFPGGPGKTRTPANLKQIIDSITKKIFVLPDDTEVYPGHGGSANLKKEKAEFAVFSSRPHKPDLCGDVLWSSS